MHVKKKKTIQKEWHPTAKLENADQDSMLVCCGSGLDLNSFVTGSRPRKANRKK